MKTSAISSPANATSAASSASKPSDPVSDLPFSQMLSREMAAKAPEASNSKAPDSRGPQAAQSTPSDDKPEDAKTVNASATAATTESNANAAAAKTATARDVKNKSAQSDDAQQDDDTTVSAASAEMLALVANLTQVVGTRADPKGSELPADGKAASLDASDAEADGKGPATELAAAMSAGAQLLGANAAQQAQDQAGMKPANGAITDTVASTARRAHGVGHGQAAHADATQQLKDRAEAGATGKTETEPKEFDAKLAQSRDDKTAPEAGAGKAATDKVELRAAEGGGSMKTMAQTVKDVQQIATAMTPNMSAMTAPVPAAAVPSQMTDMLSPRVGSQGWDQALGQKIVWMVGSEQQSATLTLNPPDLGPLQVVLNVSDSQATANFTAAQPEVRHALEAAMPKLREMLGDAGIQLSQANVSAGTPNNQQNGSDQRQPSARPSGDAKIDGGNDAPARVVRSQTIIGKQGLVDTFV